MFIKRCMRAVREGQVDRERERERVPLFSKGITQGCGERERTEGGKQMKKGRK